MNSFSVQLLALLGVPSLPPTVRCAQHDSTLTDWQIDALLRRRILENVDKSTETLSSIVQLVDQIQSMPVGAGVKGDVQDALSALEKVSVCIFHLGESQICDIHFRSLLRRPVRQSRLFYTLPTHSCSLPAHFSIRACWHCYISPLSTSMPCTHPFLRVSLCPSWQLSRGKYLHGDKVDGW